MTEEARNLKHNATIGFDSAQVALSIKVHALQEAVRVVDILIGGSIPWRELINDRVTIPETGNKVLALAKVFEGYLTTGNATSTEE